MVQGHEIPPGHEPAEEAARRAGHNFEVFKRMCREGRIPGAHKIRGPGGGLWVVPKNFRILPTGEKPRIGEERGREVARRARSGESKAALAREYGISRDTVYNVMERYPEETPDPPRDGPRGARQGRGTPPRTPAGVPVPPGYEVAQEAAKKRGRNFEVFKRMLRAGRVPGAYKIPGSGGGLWVVPENFTILPTSEKPGGGEERGREVARRVGGQGPRFGEERARTLARRAHAGEPADVSREYGIGLDTIHDLMELYPDEAPGPSRDGPTSPGEDAG